MWAWEKSADGARGVLSYRGAGGLECAQMERTETRHPTCKLASTIEIASNSSSDVDENNDNNGNLVHFALL